MMHHSSVGKSGGNVINCHENNVTNAKQIPIVLKQDWFTLNKIEVAFVSLDLGVQYVPGICIGLILKLVGTGTSIYKYILTFDW